MNGKNSPGRIFCIAINAVAAQHTQAIHGILPKDKLGAGACALAPFLFPFSLFLVALLAGFRHVALQYILAQKNAAEVSPRGVPFSGRDAQRL
jgi:hypothetical protein